METEDVDWEKIYLLVQDLAEEKEELQAQVHELQKREQIAEDNLFNVKEQCGILENKLYNVELSLETQVDEKANLHSKLHNQKIFNQTLVDEIKYLKIKADNFNGSVDDELESHNLVKRRIKDLEGELLQKEEDHMRTQNELTELTKRMAETEVNRNKVREMHKRMLKAEEMLQNAEMERRHSVDETILLKERERELEQRNQELERKLQEALLILQTRQQELNETKRQNLVASQGESLAELTELSESDEENMDNVKTFPLNSEDGLVGTVDELEEEESDGELLGKIKKGLFYECEICNKFLVPYQQRCVYTTEKIFRKHQRSKHHKDNVSRLKMGLGRGDPVRKLEKIKRGDPLRKWDELGRWRRANGKGRRPPMVKNNVDKERFRTEASQATNGHFVEELSLDQIFKFQMTLNAMKDM